MDVALYDAEKQKLNKQTFETYAMMPWNIEKIYGHAFNNLCQQLLWYITKFFGFKPLKIDIFHAVFVVN